MEKKRLYRSRDNKVFAGIFGGLDNYFNVDATLLRLIWILVVIFTLGIPGILAYIIAWLVVPLEPTSKAHGEE